MKEVNKLSKKREQLLTQSERLFDRHGFHAVGLKQVIKESGISLMTMYNHFESKEALVLEILKKREARYLQKLDQFTEKKTGKDFMHALAEAHLSWIRDNGSNGCMFLRAKEEYSLAQAGHSAIVSFADQHKHRLTEFIHDKGFTNQEAVRVMILLEGATAMAEVFDIEEVATEVNGALKALFTN